MVDKIDNKKQAYAKAKSIRTSGQKVKPSCQINSEVVILKLL